MDSVATPAPAGPIYAVCQDAGMGSRDILGVWTTLEAAEKHFWEHATGMPVGYVRFTFWIERWPLDAAIPESVERLTI